MRIYSVLSFPRWREHSQIKRLDPRLCGDDELIGVSLIICCVHQRFDLRLYVNLDTVLVGQFDV